MLLNLLNIVFRDRHQFAMRPFLDMLPSGTYDGVEITPELMLLGGVLAEVPIAMVLLSLLLARRLGRPVTFSAALVTTATMLSFAPRDMDDVLQLAVQLAAMTAIVRTAWRWPDDGRAEARARG